MISEVSKSLLIYGGEEKNAPFLPGGFSLFEELPVTPRRLRKATVVAPWIREATMVVPWGIRGHLFT